MIYHTATVRWASGEVHVGSPAATDSREAFLEDSSLTSEAQAVEYGTAWLAAHATTIDQVDVGVTPISEDVIPWTGRNKGDALQLRNRAGTVETGRVHGVGFTGLYRNGVPKYTFTVGSASQERNVKAALQLGRLAQGSERGTFGATTINPAPSFGTLESGSLPHSELAVADTDEFRLDEPYDRTKPLPFEQAKAIVRINCACESLVGSDDSKIEVWRVAYAADGTSVVLGVVDSFIWPGTVYRFTRVTEIQFAHAQGYQLRNAQAPGATVRIDEVFAGSRAAGAHRLISVTAIASSAN